MGFDLGQLVEDAGKQLQTDATSWLKNEISNRVSPVQVQAQPPATQTVAQNDASKLPTILQNKNILIYAALGIVAVLVLVFAFKKGSKRGK